MKQSSLRRRVMLEGCKWDPQVGDANTLASFPMVMPRRVWNEIAGLAELLAAEVGVAEAEILNRSELLGHLGLPKALQRVLAGGAHLTPAAGRVIRFDFHLTTQGWKISEANSDVPGGFGEGSYFTRLMAAQYPRWRMAGDPAAAWREAVASAAGPAGVIALLSAPDYMEDYQVTAFLAARLREAGCHTHLARPDQIVWRDGIAHLDTAWFRGPLRAIIRFYQAEWLSRLPVASGWRHFFRGGLTLVANPAVAVISESKRFLLLWNHLTTGLPTWRSLLPETRDPREVPWDSNEEWLLKTAFCNTGDTVSARAWLPSRKWWQVRWNARLFPGNWVAQRRFESLPISTPAGRRHVCVGVYTVNGKAAGAYTRLSERPLVDYTAVDAALLIEENE